MRHFLAITLFITAFVFNISNVQAQEEEIIAIQEEPICVNPSVVSVQAKKAPNNKGYVVYVNNKQTLWFVKDLPSLTAQKRAEMVAEKIDTILQSGLDPATIKPVKSGNYTFLQAGNEKIATVDEINAKAVGVSVHELAYTWANNTRSALGTSALRKDYTDVSRGFSGKQSRYLGHKTVGMASWYGPNFHGKRAADGSRYNANEYTAAHRTYPFGTLVKVTNLKNSKSCVVKITDRGPYAHGRIIDLSSRAAKDIGVSGVVKVKLEVIGQY
ncbi:MAG: septal ring lytic transglycosylase RlpA family protein [Candidatus Gastranaerophilales bacterium]|nr:septal ring lytic transglycosylase RlpA family protein [Candidatus Gastranaerophilales bacterium]